MAKTNFEAMDFVDASADDNCTGISCIQDFSKQSKPPAGAVVLMACFSYVISLFGELRQQNY